MQRIMKDEDYNPYGSPETDTRSQMLRSRSGRPVKAKKLTDVSETEDEEEVPSGNTARKRQSPSLTRTSDHTRSKPAKRQRWQPHNPRLFSKTEDESSKDIQISEDDESGEEGMSRSRRRASNTLKGSSIPVRDESGRFAGTRLQTEQERRQAALAGNRSAAGGGGIFKNAAVQVLRQELKLMSTGEIARLAMKRGYIKVQGRTPEATMASAMYTDVKRKEDRSLFIRPHEGLFGLREWIDEEIEFHDPLEAQPSRLGIQRSRMSNPSNSQPNSRNSNRLAQKSRSLEEGHHNDDYTSQATSRRGESHLDQEARTAVAFDANLGVPSWGNSISSKYEAPLVDHTPFGDHREGPSADMFMKPRIEGPGRNGFSNVRKRSVSGPLAPYLQAQPATSGGRKAVRRPSATMSPQNSGHMSLLLDAVELEKRNSGLLQKPAPLQERRTPTILHPQTVHPRTESGYNIFGNKPLPFQAPSTGSHTRPDAEGRSGLANRISGNSIPREEAFQQLEASFVSQPLQISNSLLGPLPAAIPPLNLGGTKDHDGSGASNSTALPQGSSPSIVAPKALRIPGSAFQVTGPPQMPGGAGAPNFGPPEEGVKRISEVEAHVQTMENSLGLRHPRVGKGYLYLSRVYQLKATSAPEYYSKAQQALSHAYEICYAGQVTPKVPGSSI